MFIPFFFLFSIPFVISISNQEDLSISNYSHIGCLTLNSDKQFVNNQIQENSLLAHQTYTSSNMTIELCFRLCRRWIILINKNHTNCLCLYTVTTPYQFNEFLGKVLSVNNCTSNDLEIYSLTKDFYVFPSPSSIYDWSLDGCYYLHGIQNHPANLSLIGVNYTQAIDSCRKHCQSARPTNYFSFFLSLKKSCYCLPITLPKTVVPKAIRKPLIHCSFLPYIKNGFDNSLNFTEVNSDTVVKINVQRYCSSLFIFDRDFYLCLKPISLDTLNTYSKINTGERCVPILIQTYQQWTHLTSLSNLLRSPTFIWIDRNSNYIFNDLFKSKNSLLTPNDYCIVVNRTNSNRLPSFDLVPCPTAYSSGSALCAQKPIETIISDQADFRSIDNKEQYPINDSFSCPPEFVLFNNICYYVHPSFVYNIPQGEHVCLTKYRNSTLMKYDSHDWGNVNTTRFLGRSFDDILLEVFYYQLEQRLIIEFKNETKKKHWLRLLLGDKNDKNECILRYFIRSSSAFTILYRCEPGGHPVCQCQPEILKINSPQIDIKPESTTTTTTEMVIVSNSTNSSQIDIKPESTTTTTAMMIVSNSTNPSNETIIPICDNCTNIIADEDLLINETSTDFILTKSKTQRSNSQRFLMMVTVPLLASVILIIGSIFLIRHVRRSRGSYAIRTSRRAKPTSTPSPNTSNPPSVLYTRLIPSPPSITMDADMTLPFDNSIIIDDNVQLLPNSTNIHENIITEDEEDGLYATLKLPNEK